MFLNFQMWRAEIHVNLQGICQRKAESFSCAHLGVKSPCYGYVAVRWMDVSPITMSIYGGDPLLRHAEAAPHIDSVRSPWYGDNTDVEFHVLGAQASGSKLALMHGGIGPRSQTQKSFAAFVEYDSWACASHEFRGDFR